MTWAWRGWRGPLASSRPATRRKHGSRPQDKGNVPAYAEVSRCSLISPASASSRFAAHQPSGRVRYSNPARYSSASSRLPLHISSIGLRLAHTAGRSGWPKIAHRMSGSSCTQGMPAGLPCGIPGIGDEMLGAMQQAPQFGRHSMLTTCLPLSSWRTRNLCGRSEEAPSSTRQIPMKSQPAQIQKTSATPVMIESWSFAGAWMLELGVFPA